MSRGRSLPRRLHRSRFGSDVDHMVSVLKYLDWRYPGPEQQAKRVAKWSQIEREASAWFSKERLLALILTSKPLSGAERAELDRLVTQYHLNRKGARNRA